MSFIFVVVFGLIVFGTSVPETLLDGFFHEIDELRDSAFRSLEGRKFHGLVHFARVVVRNGDGEILRRKAKVVEGEPGVNW